MQAYQKRKEEHMNSEVDNHYMHCDHCGEMVAGSHNCPSRGEEEESILKDVFWIIVKTLMALFVLMAVSFILFFPFYILHTFGHFIPK